MNRRGSFPHLFDFFIIPNDEAPPKLAVADADVVAHLAIEPVIQQHNLELLLAAWLLFGPPKRIPKEVPYPGAAALRRWAVNEPNEDVSWVWITMHESVQVDLFRQDLYVGEDQFQISSLYHNVKCIDKTLTNDQTSGLLDVNPHLVDLFCVIDLTALNEFHCEHSLCCEWPFHLGHIDALLSSA